MKICYIFDDSYISQFLTVTNSIISNEEKIANSIEFYIAYFGNKETISTLIQLAELHFPNNKFHVKHIPSEFPHLQIRYNRTYDFKKAAYHIQTSSVLCRFDLDEIWTEIDGKILYLDLDIIVKHSISEFYSSLQGSKIFYACKHRKLSNEMKFINFGEPANPEHLRSFISCIKNGYDKYIEKTSVNENILQKFLATNYDLDGPAFNAGIFVLDLRQYRQNKYFKDFANFLIDINRYDDIFRHNDQSVLNIIFYEHTSYFDRKWNATDYGWFNREEAARLQEEFDDSHIIHFCGPDKPWLPSNKIKKIILFDKENHKFDINDFYELNEVDASFDEVEYAKTFPETKDFYNTCLDHGFSDKQRLYYHYCMYGNCPTYNYFEYFSKGIKLWQQYQIKGV